MIVMLGIAVGALAMGVGALVWWREVGRAPRGGYRGHRLVSDLELPTQDKPPPPAVPARLVRERVIVTLKSGAAFRGVLYEADDHGWVLREAEAFGARDAVVVDGEVFVFTRDVDYVQKP